MIFAGVVIVLVALVVSSNVLPSAASRGRIDVPGRTRGGHAVARLVEPRPNPPIPQFGGGAGTPEAPPTRPNPGTVPSALEPGATQCIPGSESHVLFSFDERDLPGFFIATQSMFAHASSPECIRVHVLCPSSAEADIRAACSCAMPPSACSSLHFVRTRPLTRTVTGSETHGKHLGSPYNLGRLEAFDALPPSVHRFAYLDADILVLGDIHDLVHFDMQGNATAFAWEPDRSMCNPWGVICGHPALEQAGLTKQLLQRKKVGNAGIMVVDLDEWRRLDLSRQARLWSQLNHDGKLFLLGSQPPIMLATIHSRAQLPNQWNLKNERRKDTKLVHFAGPGKPWQVVRPGPYAEARRFLQCRVGYSSASTSADRNMVAYSRYIGKYGVRTEGEALP